ncbi:hypothetical protein [Nocardioides sp. T2.26MG-1]|uniref:hypothetical protein n=1 Tax=Nocardioides sp. T2.26MG-1 TaxID=3041166 RepID=UPI002477B06D|nr:hypothetical protein [Nocardioides sp. T2.26MG-1]CAI9417249.1 hypothetical protein HIDPHFAB_02973 [Nocardioides sp. T2.26MG-1]
MTTTAKINAATGSGSGIAPDLARTLHDQLGKTITAVVSLRSESRGEKLNGDETVSLAITDLVVIPDDQGAAEHVREIAHVVTYNRKLAENGPTLPLDGDSPEPKVEDVLAAGARHRPHGYIASTLSTDDDAICDICGLLQTAPIHSTQGTLPDPFTIPDDDGDDPTHGGDGPDPDDSAYEPHDFIDDGNGTCLECDQPETSAIHTEPEPDPAG